MHTESDIVTASSGLGQQLVSGNDAGTAEERGIRMSLLGLVPAKDSRPKGFEPVTHHLILKSYFPNIFNLNSIWKISVRR